MGICATSHKEIGNLLDATCEAAREVDYTMKQVVEDAERPSRSSENWASCGRWTSRPVESLSWDHTLKIGSGSTAAMEIWD